MWTQGPASYAGPSLRCPPSSCSLQAWHHRGTHRDRSCALPAPAPPLFCPRPSSPSGWEVGRKDGGQSPGPRLQPGFTVRGQRSREAGAPSQQAFMRHYTPSLSYSGPAPLPLRSSQCPAPQVHLGGHSGVTPASALVHGPSGPTCILGHFPSCPILLILVLILSISEATLGRAIG